MYDHSNENRHTTLIAGLILVILLAAVAAFATPVATVVSVPGTAEVVSVTIT